MPAAKEDKLHVSRRNRVSLSSDHPKVRTIAIELAAGQEGTRRKAYSDPERTLAARHFELLLLDLLAANSTDPELYIGFSAGMRAFANGGSYWDPIAGAPTISKTYYLDAVKTLEKLGLAEVHIADQGYGGFSSRIRATGELISLLSDLSWADIKSERGRIIVKQGDDIVAWPEDAAFDPQEAQVRLDRINESLEATFVNLNVPDEELARLNRKIAADGELSEGVPKEPFDFSNRTLNRIFAEGTFAKGGRFYGGWWQSVPSELRKFIEIDGRVTVELDFSSMQPRVLYAEAGAKPPNDAYTLPGWPEKLRPLIKRLFSQLLNSGPSSANPSQWHRFAPTILPPGRTSLSKGEQNKMQRKIFERRMGKDYSELIADLLNFHAPIRDKFFTKAWGRMQRTDSDVAELVMLRLLDQPVKITALPIHDSFIVGRGDEAITHKFMLDAFREVVRAGGAVARDKPIFEPDENADPVHIVIGGQLHDEVRTHIKTHGRYYAREQEWMRSRGFID